MSYQRETFTRIKAEFSRKYIAAQEKASVRRAELYAALPEVQAIDRELSMTGIKIMNAVSSGKDAKQKVEAIQAENEKLQAKRGAILTANGFPEDYSDIHYECKKCGDTGYVDLKMCDCMKRALTEAGYEASGLGGLIRTQSFENFSLDYYTGSAEQRATMERNVNFLRRFAEEFCDDTYANFLFFGATGLGKTHLSTAVAKKAIERGADVLYVTALGMIGDFEARRFGEGVGMRNDPTRYTDAELLIIDDLGTEVTNQFTIACLYDVINQRINQRKSTIINTNLSLLEMEKRYSDRITSRLLGEYRMLMFAGADIRRQKVSKGK